VAARAAKEGQNDYDDPDADQEIAQAETAAALRAAGRIRRVRAAARNKVRSGRASAGAVIRGFRRIVNGQIGAVDVSDLLKQRVKIPYAGSRIVLLREIWLQVLVPKRAEIACGQVALETRALHRIVVVIADRKDHQNAVVLLRVTDLPAVKERVGVILERAGRGGAQRHKHDLRAGRVIQRLRVDLDVVLRIAGQNARKVAGIVARRLDDVYGQRRRGGESQNENRRQRSEYSFHNLPPF
jgi:hypothetical protein